MQDQKIKRNPIIKKEQEKKEKKERERDMMRVPVANQTSHQPLIPLIPIYFVHNEYSSLPSPYTASLYEGSEESSV